MTAGLAGLMGVAIIVIGMRYLLAPEASAATFGLPAGTSRGSTAWLEVKGVRDVVSGLLGFAFLAAGQFRELGWFLIIVALIPQADALIVLRHHGTAAALVAIGSILAFG